MAAYLIAQHTVVDPIKFGEYRAKVGPIIAKHGGRYITKAGSHKVLEEANNLWRPDGVIIIQFPDMTALNAWYSSPDYQALIALRQASAKVMLTVLEGA
jgi:uncharacterized protein (DUF1330 family)